VNVDIPAGVEEVYDYEGTHGTEGYPEMPVSYIYTCIFIHLYIYTDIYVYTYMYIHLYLTIMTTGYDYQDARSGKCRISREACRGSLYRYICTHNVGVYKYISILVIICIHLKCLYLWFSMGLGGWLNRLIFLHLYSI
jgi:hypothetical protein